MITKHHQANTKTGFSTGLIYKLLNLQEVLSIHSLHSEKRKKKKRVICFDYLYFHALRVSCRP